MQCRFVCHRIQVSTKTCSGKVSIWRLRARTPTTLSQPAMASNRLIAMPNVRPACCRPGLQRRQRALDARANARPGAPRRDARSAVPFRNGSSPGLERQSDPADLPE
jgi:hypothetical protein